MQQKYTVTHGPTGRAVTVLAYTPEEAHAKSLAPLNKLLGASAPGAMPGTAAAAVAPATPTLAGHGAAVAQTSNTTVTVTQTGAPVESKKKGH